MPPFKPLKASLDLKLRRQNKSVYKFKRGQIYIYNEKKGGGAMGVDLNVESTTNIQFFYILQQKMDKNLHLQQIL